MISDRMVTFTCTNLVPCLSTSTIADSMATFTNLVTFMVYFYDCRQYASMIADSMLL